MHSPSNAPLQAMYFDGVSARAHAIDLQVDNGQLVITGESVTRSAPLSTLRVSERFANSPRLVTFADGAYCQIEDHAAFEALLATTGFRDHFVARLHNSWRLAIGGLLTLVAILTLAYLFLLPVAVDRFATHLPVEIDQAIGEQSLKLLDKVMFSESKLDDEAQARITDRFQSLAAITNPPPYQLIFRTSKVGPNAFALPGGAIVMTDQMVKVATDDNALFGVLAHELGHVRERHALRQLIQGSVVSIALGALIGDASSLLVGIGSGILDMRYSRQFETQADDAAVVLLTANRLPVKPFADLLQQLTDHAKKQDKQADDSSGYFSSHPPSHQRIERILSGAPL